MCDICNVLKIDKELRCGLKAPKSEDSVARLRNMYVNHHVLIKLCYIHDIEFFKVGERRFLLKYPKLVAGIARGDCGKKVSSGKY